MEDWKALREKRFPKEILHAAQATEREYGVPAAVTLAQWALESAYGQRSPGNNPFGHKGSYMGNSVEFVTHEVINGERVRTTDKFCRYPSIEVAFKEHGRKLSRGKPYLGCLPLMRENWRLWVRCIARKYATDPKYADKVLGLIDRFKLDGFNLPSPDDKKEGK